MNKSIHSGSWPWPLRFFWYYLVVFPRRKIKEWRNPDYESAIATFGVPAVFLFVTVMSAWPWDFVTPVLPLLKAARPDQIPILGPILVAAICLAIGSIFDWTLIKDLLYSLTGKLLYAWVWAICLGIAIGTLLRLIFLV